MMPAMQRKHGQISIVACNSDIMPAMQKKAWSDIYCGLQLRHDTCIAKESMVRYLLWPATQTWCLHCKRKHGQISIVACNSDMMPALQKKVWSDIYCGLQLRHDTCIAKESMVRYLLWPTTQTWCLHYKRKCGQISIVACNSDMMPALQKKAWSDIYCGLQLRHDACIAKESVVRYLLWPATQTWCLHCKRKHGQISIVASNSDMMLALQKKVWSDIYCGLQLRHDACITKESMVRYLLWPATQTWCLHCKRKHGQISIVACNSDMMPALQKKAWSDIYCGLQLRHDACIAKESMVRYLLWPATQTWCLHCKRKHGQISIVVCNSDMIPAMQKKAWSDIYCGLQLRHDACNRRENSITHLLWLVTQTWSLQHMGNGSLDKP